MNAARVGGFEDALLNINLEPICSGDGGCNGRFCFCRLGFSRRQHRRRGFLFGAFEIRVLSGNEAFSGQFQNAAKVFSGEGQLTFPLRNQRVNAGAGILRLFDLRFGLTQLRFQSGRIHPRHHLIGVN